MGGIVGALLTGVLASSAWGSPNDGVLLGDAALRGKHAVGVLVTIVYAGVGTTIVLKGVALARAGARRRDAARREVSPTTVKMELHPKVRLEIGVSDTFVQATVDAIVNGARTGEVAHGKIFVLPVEKVVRIRTGEEGRAAVTPVT